jgi:hypothetical protein
MTFFQQAKFKENSVHTCGNLCGPKRGACRGREFWAIHALTQMTPTPSPSPSTYAGT